MFEQFDYKGFRAYRSNTSTTTYRKCFGKSYPCIVDLWGIIGLHMPGQLPLLTTRAEIREFINIKLADRECT